MDRSVDLDFGMLLEELCPMDKVSLVFLVVADNLPEAFDEIYEDDAFLGCKDFLNKLLEQKDDRILESLTNIQCFKILKILGHEEADLVNKYQPDDDRFTDSIHQIKKTIYRIIDKFSKDDLQLFLQTAQNYLETNGLKFKSFPNDVRFIEKYLLHWCSVGYITISYDKENVKSDLTILKNIFKEMDKMDAYWTLESSETDCNNDSFEYTDESDNSCVESLRTNEDRETDQYEIVDSENVGLCIVINQYLFNVESENGKNELKERQGSHADVKRIERTMKLFGFTVVCHNNLTSKNFLKTISKDIRLKFRRSMHSTVWVYVLSHGEKDVVYCNDGETLSISHIEDVFFQTEMNKNLAGIPKVLIIQSCQGKRLQKSVSPSLPLTGQSGNLELDSISPSLSCDMFPEFADLLTFKSACRDFSSIRHKQYGSWFIIILCQSLVSFGMKSERTSLNDICTHVIGQVSAKSWNRNRMVPVSTSTMGKLLFLPQIYCDYDDVDDLLVIPDDVFME